MDTITHELIRAQLDATTSTGPIRPEAEALEPVSHIERIRAAKRLVDYSEQLLAEVIADARAVPARGIYYTVGADHGYGHTMLRREALTSDRSPSRYGWDVIGWALGISKQAAAQRFSS